MGGEPDGSTWWDDVKTAYGYVNSTGITENLDIASSTFLTKFNGALGFAEMMDSDKSAPERVIGGISFGQSVVGGTAGVISHASGGIGAWGAAAGTMAVASGFLAMASTVAGIFSFIGQPTASAIKDRTEEGDRNGETLGFAAAVTGATWSELYDHVVDVMNQFTPSNLADQAGRQATFEGLHRGFEQGSQLSNEAKQVYQMCVYEAAKSAGTPVYAFGGSFWGVVNGLANAAETGFHAACKYEAKRSEKSDGDQTDSSNLGASELFQWVKGFLSNIDFSGNQEGEATSDTTATESPSPEPAPSDSGQNGNGPVSGMSKAEIEAVIEAVANSKAENIASAIMLYFTGDADLAEAAGAIFKESQTADTAEPDSGPVESPDPDDSADNTGPSGEDTTSADPAKDHQDAEEEDLGLPDDDEQEQAEDEERSPEGSGDDGGESQEEGDEQREKEGEGEGEGESEDADSGQFNMEEDAAENDLSPDVDAGQYDMRQDFEGELPDEGEGGAEPDSGTDQAQEEQGENSADGGGG